MSIVLILAVGCNRRPSRLEQALTLAGDNRAELEKVLEHYSADAADSLKYRAAVFLIENMPYHQYAEYPESADYHRQLDTLFANPIHGQSQMDSLADRIRIQKNRIQQVRDIHRMQATCLISQIDQAFETRRYGWTQVVGWDDFCEYILPYRVDYDPPEDWRPLYGKRMQPVLDSLNRPGVSAATVCEMLTAFFDPPDFFLLDNRLPLKPPPSLLMKITAGNCYDLALFGIYAMRTAGLPVTYDFTPQWANRSLGHEWNVLLTDSAFITFQIDDAVPFGHHIQSKSSDRMPKAYRRMYSIQQESLAMQSVEEEIPPLFRNPFLRDVSMHYFDAVDVTVTLTVPPPVPKEIAYVMVFDNRDWSPVGWGKIRKDRVMFPKMNRKCVYVAMYYDRGCFYPASAAPFLIDRDGNLQLYTPHAGQPVSATVQRKFPCRDVHILQERMPGGRFQLADKPDFSDAVTVHVVDTLSDMVPQRVKPDGDHACQYFRYKSAGIGHVFMAELEVYDPEGNQLSGEIIGTEGSYWNNGMDRTKAFDGNMLTYCESPVGDGWVGLKFAGKTTVKEIVYVPRNDDNHINANELYELYYYDRGWVSLGAREGDKTYQLVYDNVPGNALLLLRNHTKGSEERIFTYENDKQVWW
ncbi:MAG: discoidin domain-containing protein [Tannerella sp.]|nr:discoidin domain-containing protein [Tannerella sp.]